MLLIRSDRAVRNVSTPQSRLRRASPPWQGGPRGLSNFATKCNLLPLLQGEAKGSALLQQTATISTKSSIHQPNFDASETERTRPTTERVQKLPKAEHRTDASAHKQGVQGGTPWAFSVPFCAQKGMNQGGFALDLIEQSPGLFDPPGRAPVRRGHRQGVVLTNCNAVEVQPPRASHPQTGVFPSIAQESPPEQTGFCAIPPHLFTNFSFLRATDVL